MPSFRQKFSTVTWLRKSWKDGWMLRRSNCGRNRKIQSLSYYLPRCRKNGTEDFTLFFFRNQSTNVTAISNPLCKHRKETWILKENHVNISVKPRETSPIFFSLTILVARVMHRLSNDYSTRQTSLLHHFLIIVEFFSPKSLSQIKAIWIVLKKDTQAGIETHLKL